MKDQGERYAAGKETEGSTWEYLYRYNFVRPSQLHRKVLVQAFASRNITLHPSGFDVVEARFLPYLESLDRLNEVLDDITLYEVKSAGKSRRAPVSSEFRGLGFTLTSKERDNAAQLGDRYRFIFVNLRTGTHAIYALSEFFRTEVARIYPTWSVFISQDLGHALHNRAAIETPSDLDRGSVQPQ